jgi:hypothetical protein
MKRLQKIRKKIEGKQITEEEKELRERQDSINEKMQNNYENKRERNVRK